MLYCKNEKCKEYRTRIPHNCLNWESNLSRDCGFMNAPKSDATVVSSDEALKKLINAAENIHHWHCWGKNNEGMVVSSESVHNLWKVLIEIKRAEVVQKPNDLKNVICPQCSKKFRLTWNDSSCGDKKQTLYLRGCPSDGIYYVSMNCPHCNYEEEL